MSLFCDSCSKLNLLNGLKTCVRCGQSVLFNLAVLCSKCSLEGKQCAICIKKIISKEEQATKKYCKGCGAK